MVEILKLFKTERRRRKAEYIDIASKKGLRELEETLKPECLAVVFVHPSYAILLRTLAQSKFLTSEGRLDQELQKYQAEFDSYATRVRNLFKKASYSDIPILILNDPETTVSDSLSFLGVEDVSISGLKIFHTQTHYESPLPSFYAESEGRSAMLRFTKMLKDKGLKTAVVAGVYFGGERSFGNQYRVINGVFDNMPQKSINRLASRGCVGATLLALCTAGVETLLSNATFPQRPPNIKQVLIERDLDNNINTLVNPLSPLPNGVIPLRKILEACGITHQLKNTRP